MITNRGRRGSIMLKAILWVVLVLLVLNFLYPVIKFYQNPKNPENPKPKLPTYDKNKYKNKYKKKSKVKEELWEEEEPVQEKKEDEKKQTSPVAQTNKEKKKKNSRKISSSSKDGDYDCKRCKSSICQCCTRCNRPPDDCRCEHLCWTCGKSPCECGEVYRGQKSEHEYEDYTGSYRN